MWVATYSMSGIDQMFFHKMRRCWWTVYSFIKPEVSYRTCLQSKYYRLYEIRPSSQASYTASITCSSLLSSPGYCTHLLLGGASRMPLTVNDLRESWGEAFDRVSTRKTHHHSSPSVKSLTMICSRRFAPIIHMFCTVSCRRNLHVYTLCENDTIILFCLTIPSHSWIAISSIEFYIKTPML